MTTVYFNTKEHNYTIREPYHDDDWDRGVHGCDITLLDARLTAPRYPYENADTEEVIEPGDVLFVVKVTYSTGDTFGRNDGCVDIPFVSKDASLAMEVKEQIQNKTYDNPQGYNPWDGYFEYLQDVEVQTFLVNP